MEELGKESETKTHMDFLLVNLVYVQSVSLKFMLKVLLGKVNFLAMVCIIEVPPDLFQSLKEFH